MGLPGGGAGGFQVNPGIAPGQVRRAGVGGAAQPVRARRLTDEIRGQVDPINGGSPLVTSARGPTPPTETAQGDVVPSSVTERASDTLTQREGQRGGRRRRTVRTDFSRRDGDINSAGFQSFGNTLLGRGAGGGRTLLGR